MQRGGVVVVVVVSGGAGGGGGRGSGKRKKGNAFKCVNDILKIDCSHRRSVTGHVVVVVVAINRNGPYRSKFVRG